MAAERTLKLTANQTRAISLKAPAGLASSYSIQLPEDPGTAGYQLATDGNGVLSWVPPGGSEDFAQVNILGQGPLVLRDVDDSASVSIRAPAVVVSSYVLTLPDDLPAVSGFFQVDAAGVVSFVAGSADLQTAYDSGAEIILDASGPVTLTNDEDEVALRIDTTASSASPSLEIVDEGTGGCVNLVQTGNGVGLTIAKAGGAAAVADLSGSGAISGSILKLTTPAAGSGIGLEVLGASSGIAAKVTQATTAAVALQVNQGTDAIALEVNKTGAGAGNAVDVDDDGTGVALAIVKDGVGLALSVTQNAAAALATFTQTQDQEGLRVNKTGAGAGIALLVDNDGTAAGIHVEQDGAGPALVIDQDGAGIALTINQTQNARGISLVKTGAGGGSAAYIENDGTGIGLQVVQDGDAIACSIVAASASADPCLFLSHLSADPISEIQGTDWYVNNRGTARFRRISFHQATHTIAAGAITITSALPGGRLLVLGEGGVADNLDSILSDSSDPVEDSTIITVEAGDTAVTITARSSQGNLRLDGNTNFGMSGAGFRLTLQYDSSSGNWYELSRSNNPD